MHRFWKKDNVGSEFGVSYYIVNLFRTLEVKKSKKKVMV